MNEDVNGVNGAVHDTGTFELEGDAENDVAVAGDDWDNVLDPDIADGASATTGLLTDAMNDTIFTGGGSKDYQLIQGGPWKHKDGSVPDKDDLLHAFAAAYNVGTDFVVYFGADRITTEGSAELGFWFFRNEVTLDSDGTFNGEHEEGDLLILASFTQGGAVSTIHILEWVGEGGDEGGGALQTIASSSAAECDLTDLEDDTACAIANADSENSPWTYIPKGETLDQDFPPHSFFEGGVNLTALFEAQGEDVPCFASFMAETRSSAEVNATLKDFVLGSFPVCDIDITKSCDSSTLNEAQNGFIYTYSGTVTNDGAGTLYDVTVTDNNGTPNDLTDDDVHVIGTLAPGATAPYSGSFETSINGLTNTATVTGAGVDDGPVVVTETASDTCPLTQLSPVISADKICHTELDDSSGEIVVQVVFSGQVCNTSSIGGAAGPVTLTDVEVFDTHCNIDPSDDTPIADLDSLASGECKPYGDDYTPSDAGESVFPIDATFVDCVRAVGSTALFGNVEATASATCYLCPQP